MPQTFSSSSISSSPAATLFYQTKAVVASNLDVAQTEPAAVAVTTAPVRTTAHNKGKKATITDIQSLDGLRYFLEEDKRITVIK